MRGYIAGPYTNGVPDISIRNAIEVAEVLVAKGHVPFIPHLSFLWAMAYPHNRRFWLWWTKKWLETCQFIVRIKGKSEGADDEVQRAHELHLPVFDFYPEQMEASKLQLEAWLDNLENGMKEVAK